MFYEIKCTNKECERFKVSRLVKDDQAAEPCPRCGEEMNIVHHYAWSDFHGRQ